MALHVLLGTYKEHMNFCSVRKWSCQSSCGCQICKDAVLWKKEVFPFPKLLLACRGTNLEKEWKMISINAHLHPHGHITLTVLQNLFPLLIVVIPAGTRVRANDICLPLRWCWSLIFSEWFFISLKHITEAGTLTLNADWGESHDSSTASSSSCTWQGQGS